MAAKDHAQRNQTESTRPDRERRSAEQIEARLIRGLAEAAGLEPREVDVSRPFSDFGLDSAQAVELAGDLEQWLGLRLSETLLWDHPDIRSLAAYLGDDGPIARSESRPPASAGRATENEPIAITGMACRFPGAEGLEAFWELLRAGGDAIVPIPRERWDVDAFAEPELARRPRFGGFLSQVDRFDAEFFGISPREAVAMDPQQRLLLEVTYEASEDAGIPRDRLWNARAGVFVGISTHDYIDLQPSAPEDREPYITLGNTHSIAANRISYVFGMRGPSLAIDTACSSALVAAHLACESLRRGECNLAFAGGVNVMLLPHLSYAMAGAFAPDGRCKAFAAGADGYVRSEGVGVVVLKRLSEAIAAGDRIHAIILGGASNNDGRSNGLTAPSRSAQEELLRTAYRNAGVEPSSVGYVETHGTGTALGDPIEAQALGAVLGADREADRACYIASVKSNVGHLEAAAGVCGLIKAALSLRHRFVPASLHLDAINPQIPFSELGLAPNDRGRPWPAALDPARAGVSSFGFGGTNVHLVLEEPPRRAAMPAREPIAQRCQPILVSARDRASLRRSVDRLRRRLEEEDAPPLTDLAHTLAVRHTHHPTRLCFVTRSTGDLVSQLEEWLGGGLPAGLCQGQLVSGRRRKLAFVFSGHESEWIGMGRELLAEEPIFRASMEACDRSLRGRVDWSLLEELNASSDASRLDRIEVAQPAIAAVQISLAELWRSWGVQPNAVVGHSLGEIAAARVAGALSLDDSMAIVCERSRLGAQLEGQGRMVVVQLSRADAEDALQGLEERVSIAVEQGHDSSTLAGDPEALQAVVARLEPQGVRCRWLRVRSAGHCPQIDPLRPALRRALADLSPQCERLPFLSTVTGEFEAGEALDAAYWERNAREPVLFWTALRRLVGDGFSLFLEVSPHPVLFTAIDAGLREMGCEGDVLFSLRQGHEEVAGLLESLGGLHVLGHPIDWSRMFSGAGSFVSLPSYPWQRDRHWPDALAEHPAPRRAAREASAPGSSGRRLPVALPAYAYSLPAGGGAEGDPRLGGLCPPSAGRLLASVVGAARQSTSEPGFRIEDLRLATPPLARPGKACEVQVALDWEGGAGTLRADAASDGGWRTCARGRLRRCQRHEAPGTAAEWGAELVTPAAQDGANRLAALLDAGLERIGLERSSPGSGASARPTRIREVRCLADPGDAARARWRRDGVDGSGVRLEDDRGRPLLELAGVAFEAEDDAFVEDSARMLWRDWLYRIAWERRARTRAPSSPAGPATWILLSDAGGTAREVAAALESRGDRCLLAFHRGAAADGEIAIDPQRDEDYARIVAQAREAEPPLAGVVHLWSLDAPGTAELEPSLLEACHELACDSVVRLVRVLAALDDPPRLWVATRGAQPVGGESSALAVAQAPVWGLVRGLALEHPGLWGGIVDLDPDDPEAGPDALVSELVSPDADDQLAFRAGARLVPRLVPMAPEPVEPAAVSADATYLVSGGLGDWGLQVARFLVERGARHLVLVGRRGLEAPASGEPDDPARVRRLAMLERLAELGAEVRVARADVAEERDMAELLRELDASGPPLRGVFHLAGVASASSVHGLDGPLLRETFRPKVRGSWVLHALTRDRELDFFVCFSSAAAVWGSEGLAHYAAANHFLDVLSHHRRRQGVPALTLNWLAWLEDAGMADAAALERFARIGLRAIPREQALRILLRAIAADLTQVTVASVDWGVFKPVYEARRRRPLLDRIEAPAEAGVPEPAASDRELLAALRNRTGVERRDALRRLVREEVARVLGVADAAGVPLERGFFDIGMDSIMSVETRAGLEQRLGRRLPATVVFDHPSVEELRAYLQALLFPEPEQPADAREEPDADLVDVMSLSDAETELRIEEELAAAGS